MKQVEKINKKLAPLVNITYALSIVVESFAVDNNNNYIANIASHLRSTINETNSKVSESFGDWADHVEEHIRNCFYDENELPYICFMCHKYAMKMESMYRQIDPKFDFYQRNDVILLKKYSDRFKLEKDTLKRINETILKLMKA